MKAMVADGKDEEDEELEKLERAVEGTYQFITKLKQTKSGERFLQQRVIKGMANATESKELFLSDLKEQASYQGSLTSITSSSSRPSKKRHSPRGMVVFCK